MRPHPLRRSHPRLRRRLQPPPRSPRRLLRPAHQLRGVGCAWRTPGAGAQEQVHPFSGTTPADVNRRLNIFDPLFRSDSPEGNFEPYLAEIAEPNADGTVWQIKLRAGVTSHTGNTLTADDAIWSIQQAGDVEAGNYGSPFGNFMDLATGLKKVDDVTFEMHLDQAGGDIGAISRDTSSIVAPTDWNADPAKPVGTGPFKFESFTPGERSLFKSQ